MILTKYSLTSTSSLALLTAARDACRYRLVNKVIGYIHKSIEFLKRDLESTSSGVHEDTHQNGDTSHAFFESNIQSTPSKAGLLASSFITHTKIEGYEEKWPPDISYY